MDCLGKSANTDALEHLRGINPLHSLKLGLGRSRVNSSLTLVLEL